MLNVMINIVTPNVSRWIKSHDMTLTNTDTDTNTITNTDTSTDAHSMFTLPYILRAVLM